MKRALKLFRYELKNIIRDSMTIVMLVYPIMLIIVGSFLLPLLLDRFGGETQGTMVAGIVMIILFASIAPFVSAALLGFLLLDNKDENTLDTIRVTPMSLSGYVRFKTVYAYILGVNAAFWVIMGTKWLSGDGYTFSVPGIGTVDLFENFTIPWVLVYALVAGLFTPVFALIMASLANNKIEGFAYMKFSGIIILIPALVVIETMQDAKQYLLGIVPLFWPVKGLMTAAELLEHEHNLPPILYLIIGAVFMIGLTALAYRHFVNTLEK